MLDGEDQRDPQTYAIIGAAMDVHSELGPGFLESVYQEALEHELKLRNIPFQREVAVPIHYKGALLTTRFRADLICSSEVLVELKAIKVLTNVDEAQLLNYQKATRIHRGLLLNFGASRLEVRRRVYSTTWNDRSS